ncbi:MAG: hypothetical protein K8F91_03500, partial [Candidatus Obscuribacterales bacterium]|nr:hypothetical protein [Candidatus Obscuribacterales bacterium]
MRMKDEDIQQKLVELESAILKESTELTTSVGNTELSEVKSQLPARKESVAFQAARSDLHYFGGIALLLLGIIMLFQHVKVTSGYMSWWGMSGGGNVGYLLMPLMLGIGWIIYNSRSLWGWMISAVSLFTIIFTIISGLRIYFVPVTMLNVIFMLLPFAIGAAFVLKGMG